MIKTFKKAIAIMLTLVFVLSLVPVSSLAEERTAFIPMENPSWTRSGDSYKSKPQYNGASSISAKGPTQRLAYGQYDFSPYLEYLSDSNTEIKLYIKSGGTGSGQYAYSYNVYAMPGDYTYIGTELTFDGAGKLGLHDYADLTPIAFSERTGKATTLDEYVIDTASVKSALDAGNSGKLTIVIQSNNTNTSYFTYDYEKGEDKAGITIAYDDSYGDDSAFLSEVVSSFTWSDITDEAQTAVTKATKLPTYYKGVNISWEASVPGILAEDGTITPPLGNAADVTLTATFTYKGADADAETATETREFKVTIAPEEPLTVRIPFTNYAYSRNGGDVKGKAHGYWTYSGYDCIRSAPSFLGYAQLDLSGYEEIINNANTTAVVSLECGLQYATARMDGVTGYIAPDTADNYDNKKITWNIADELGLHNTESNPVLFETDCDDFGPGEVDSAAANIATLRSAIDEGTNSLVSLYFAPAKSGNDSSMRISSENSGLFITYYESEIDNEDYFDSIKTSFTWENITKDDANLVINNLPTYYKGAKVVWSSGEGVITSSGELIPVAGQITDATLKATVTYGDYSFEESFTVKISDNAITVNDPTLTTENDIAAANFSVFNRTPEDVTYKLYLATYKGNELMEVKPFDFTINKGTSAAKDLSANLGDDYTAKFFVWSADGITPVIKNK